MIRVIAWNELHRRLRDRSVLIGCLAAPLLMAAVLGLSFAGGASATPVHIGVSGVSPQTLGSAVAASQLPRSVTVTALPNRQSVQDAVAGGTLDGGVAVSASQVRLHTMLVPVVDPGATHTPGFDVVSKGTSPLGEEYAESVAAGISSVLYAGRVPHPEATAADDPVAVAINSQSVGHGGKVNLNFFAPNIAVVFLFIGSGLGMRSLLMERAAGTLARISAAPVRPTQIVLGKLLAIFLTGLATIFVIWAVTTYGFGADWGAPLGVLLMAVGATAAMCGIGVFLTSLAKTEQQAFGITLLVGLFLALVGGNLLPSGSLPDVFQVVSLGTPNGWALVGFGRLDQLGEPASSVVGPFVVLLVIAVVAGGLALTPACGGWWSREVIAVIWVNLRRAMGDRRLLIIGTLVPVVIILITGLLEGSPKEPIGLYHPSARLLHLAQTTDGVKVRVEKSRSDLIDDILRGRVVAGIVQLPAGGGGDVDGGVGGGTSGAGASVRADFLVESSTTDAVQARTDAVALMDLMAAEGSHVKFTDATLAATPVEAPLSAFWYVAPANLVLFMGIAVLVLAAGMVETRRLGVLQRVSAAPVHRRSVVFGQMASMMVTAITMAIGLIFVGFVLFRVHWGNPLSVLLVVVLLGISVAALAVLIGTWARSQEQAIATAVIVAIIAGMLGGCVYQLSAVSSTVREVGHVVPQAWAMDAFVKLISDHATFSETLPEIGALAIFAVVLSALAVWYYSRKVFSTA